MKIVPVLCGALLVGAGRLATGACGADLARGMGTFLD